MTNKANSTSIVSDPIDASLRMDVERVARQSSSDDIKILAKAILLLAKQSGSTQTQLVDVASNDSFPASDAPAFAGGVNDTNNRT